MKKIILLTALALTSVLAKADLAPTVMLHHNGQAKYYMYYQIQNAVNDAVDGDTIYLSEGTFQPFNVNKRIMVRGAGSTTIIEGNCEIDISGTNKLTMPVLDAMCFNGDVTVKNAYKQFTLRKCKMVNLIWDGTNEFWDTKVEQCWFTNRLNLPNNVKEFNAFNSRIQNLYPHDYTQGSASFEHCNIVNVLDTIQGAIFNSCAVYNCKKFTGAASRTNFIGCVFNSCAYFSWFNAPFTSESTGISGYNCTFTNCEYSWPCSETNWNGKVVSALDGTYIGAYGGQHPFTQWPEVPGVTQYKLSIDAATKTMNVKLTVDKLVK